MIAKRHNTNPDKCVFYVNESDNLSMFADGSFQFVYSFLTLQHMGPIYAKRYVREFVRVLSPDGTVIFNCPSGQKNPREGHVTKTVRGWIKKRVPKRLARFYVKRKHGIDAPEFPNMEIFGVDRDDLEHLLRESGAEIIDIRPDYSVAPNWISWRYCATKSRT
jgi:ubiquinone/menaquinone biosynthesis C-methylase UbiE